MKLMRFSSRNAAYIISSLPKQNVNTYSFVYGLEQEGDDAYHDCSSQSSTSMPSTWACVAFELDSVARKLRLYKDGAPEPGCPLDQGSPSDTATSSGVGQDRADGGPVHVCGSPHVALLHRHLMR